MDDIAIGCHADGAGKHAREMKCDAAGDRRKITDLERFPQVGHDVPADFLQGLMAQPSAERSAGLRTVTLHEPAEQAVDHVAPIERTIRISASAFRGEEVRNAEEFGV